MKNCLLFLIVLFTAVSFAQADLIAHYNMEATSGAIIDQVGGETAEPVNTGHGYNVPGPESWGNAIKLSDNGAWQLDIAESTELNELINDFTVSAWVYIDSALRAGKTGLNANVDRIIGDDLDWDGDAWSFGIRSTGALLFTKNGVADVNSNVIVPADRWVHIAAVLSSTAGVEYYLDGVLTQTVGNTGGCVPGNDVFSIGRSYSDVQAQWFPGSMDEIRVYNTALGESEIANLLVSGNTAELDYPANGVSTIPVDAQLQWSSPTVLAADSYTLNIRMDNADWLDTANTSVTNGATSPFTTAWQRDTIYFWRIDSVKDGITYKGSTWSFTTVLSVPEFATGLPIGILANQGDDAVFTVSVTNPFTLDVSGLTYQWYIAPDTALVDDDKYVGTTTNTLTITNAASTDDGEYFCRVNISSNSATADSETARLDVKRLIGHWQFDGNLDDIVGGNTGSEGDPNFAEGMIGTEAAKFSGGAPVTLPTAALQTTSWSISWWEYSDPSAGSPGLWETMVSSGEGETGYEDFEFGRESGYRYAFGYDTGSGEYKWTPNDAELYPRGQWHFHTVAYDPEVSVVTWYINGARFYEFLNRNVSLDTVLCLGYVRGLDLELKQQFTGRIDDFKLYNYAVSATETAIEYTNYVDAVICTDNIVGDFNGDCLVNTGDVAKLAEAWMNCNMIPSCL